MAETPLRHEIYPGITSRDYCSADGKDQSSTVDITSQSSKYDALSNASNNSTNPIPANDPEHPKFHDGMSSDSAHHRDWKSLEAFSLGNNLSVPDQGIFPCPT